MIMVSVSQSNYHDKVNQITCLIRTPAGTGTGVIVHSEQIGSYYILTAKHVLLREDVQTQLGASIGEIKIYLDKDKKYPIISKTFLDKEICTKDDFALLMVNNLKESIPEMRISIAKFTSSPCFFRGYPQAYQAMEGVNIDVKYSDNDVVTTLVPLSTYDSEPKYNCKGFSGSGLFSVVGNEIYIIGIITDLKEPFQRFQVLNFSFLNDMLKIKSLPGIKLSAFPDTEKNTKIGNNKPTFEPDITYQKRRTSLFNNNQASYKDLRSIVRERTNRVVAWVGSGLSAEAGVPTWSELKARLCESLQNKAESSEEEEKAYLRKRAKQIIESPDYWLSFQLLRETLGKTTFRIEVRKNFDVVSNSLIPRAYKHILDIPVTGILNLNLDRLATRAFAEKNPGKVIVEFNGNRIGDYFHVLKNASPFIVNLHGFSSDETSWAFTRDDIKSLLKMEEYRSFLSSCFNSRTVVFIGISADDVAVGGHLENLSNLGVDLSHLYWITNASDPITNSWAEENKIQVIQYSATDSKHYELIEILKDLSNFQPSDSNAPPVALSGHKKVSTIRSTEELRRETSTEKLREELNSYATSLLENSSKKDYQQYESFCLEYDEPIYRAWYISTKPGENKIFGYELEKEIAEGAYGRVFKAKRPDGTDVAIKILKTELRRKKDMLQSFRRGVRSMRILAKRKVEGMVPYEQASEIPAFCVMDFIEGPNLNQAIQSKFIVDWITVLEVAVQLTRIIRKAHLLPERVLHRDIRPPNIMLKDYYTDPNNINVVVLDFDLSWHMGADELSMVQNSTIGGYLAPEQVARNPNVTTRNAAVDSYGLGMTLYFLRTGKEPMYLQHLHGNWQDDLYKTITRIKCHEWSSLPNRYARLIENATRDVQAERWDIAQIEGELELLMEVLKSPLTVQSGEIIAEELTQRILNICDFPNYEWNSNQLLAKVEMPSGVQMIISSQEYNKSIKLKLNWSNKGDRQYKNVRKYLKPAIEAMTSLLIKEKWKVLQETALRSDSASFGLEIPCNVICNRMADSAQAIANGLAQFQF